jgi:hypothetical protein
MYCSRNTAQRETRAVSLRTLDAATAGQLVSSERGVCGGPLAFYSANLISHTAFRQSLACISLIHQHRHSSIACTTAAVPPTAGQLVTSERGVCGGPLLSIMLTLCHILQSVSDWPVLVYFFN